MQKEKCKNRAVNKSMKDSRPKIQGLAVTPPERGGEETAKKLFGGQIMGDRHVQGAAGR
jgi:hypothetical protein